MRRRPGASSCGIIAVGQIIARGRQQPNAALGQQRNTQLLHDQARAKAATVLHGDNADAMAFAGRAGC